MTREEQFLNDFKEWIDQQTILNEKAMKSSMEIWKENDDEKARDAAIRYESRFDAYRFIQEKFNNYEQGKSFHDLPDHLLGKRSY